MPKYRVVGVSTVRPDLISSHPPGSVFEDDLDPIMEERLIASGSLVRIKDTLHLDQSDLGEPETREE